MLAQGRVADEAVRRVPELTIFSKKSIAAPEPRSGLAVITLG